MLSAQKLLCKMKRNKYMLFADNTGQFEQRGKHYWSSFF
jgi:hypothetical protein